MIETLGPSLIARGYNIVPIIRGEKRPAIKGWQQQAHWLSAADCAQWRGHGVGILTGVGAYPLAAFDIDTVDAGLAAWFEAWLTERFGLCAVRVGAAPKRLVLFRAADPGWAKVSSVGLEDMFDQRHRLEVLGAGQQFVAFGVHPSGCEYEWVDMWDGIAGLDAAELSVVTVAQVREAVAAFEKEALRRGLMHVAAPGHGANTSSTTAEGTPWSAGAAGSRGADTARDPLENYSPPLGLSIAEAQDLLRFAGDPADYDAWLRLGMALHHEGGGADGWLSVWDMWSQGAANYAGQEDLARRWEGFGRTVAAGGRPVTLKYLVKAASEAKAGEREASGAEPAVAWTGDAAVLRTEFGNARRMVAQVKGRLLWCAELGWWYHWVGNHWARAYEADVLRYAQATVDSLIDAAKALPREEAGEALKWAARSQTKGMCSAMVALAAAAPELRVEVAELDKDKALLGVANGMVDLRTGRLLPPDPRALITRVTGVRYVEGAECPVFERTVREVFKGQEAMPGFIQRLVGYSITGDPREHLMAFFIGNGGNGKSTIQNAIRFALGDHCVSAHASSFVREGVGGAAVGGARPDLLALHGARLVLVSEPPEGAELREDVIKSMAGGDALPARALYSSHIVQIQPSWTAWLSTNHKPIIKGEDTGIWRRVLPVPFLRDFENDPSLEKDVDRPARLRAEAEGVLAWCVAGAVEYYRQGLRVPGEVAASRGEYRADMDLLAEWLRERCVVGGAEGPRNVSLDALWLDWEPWARTRGELRYVHSRKLLSKRLQSRGFSKEYSMKGTVFLGLNLRNTAISDA